MYEARVLYSTVFSDPRLISDECSGVDTVGARGGARGNTTPGMADINKNNQQQYTLYPNPNEGAITIDQSITDGAPVYAEVLNAAGMVVYKETLTFNNKKAHITISSVPGLYLLKLIDSKGTVFSHKFVVR